MNPKRIARRKVSRPCQDCGRTLPVRVIEFWVNGYKYRVCRECEGAYRDRICWPVREINQ